MAELYVGLNYTCIGPIVYRLIYRQDIFILSFIFIISLIFIVGESYKLFIVGASRVYRIFGGRGGYRVGL